MAKFRFQLEAVLKYREHIERQKMLGVARLEVERRAGERVILDYQRQIREGKDDLRRVLSPVSAGEPPREGGVDTKGARLQAAASLHLQLKAQRAAVSLAGILKRLGEARAELSAAAVDRRAMEKLKENRRETWRMDEGRREGNALDEIGTLGAARKLIEGIG